MHTSRTTTINSQNKSKPESLQTLIQQLTQTITTGFEATTTQIIHQTLSRGKHLNKHRNDTHLAQKGKQQTREIEEVFSYLNLVEVEINCGSTNENSGNIS
ncbi:hypothetical protein Droror1_Dr00012810 [Drosera rotundifolia]